MSEHYDRHRGFVIRSSYRETGHDGWWNADAGLENPGRLLPQIGSATFYADEALANETARWLRETGRIGDYSVEPYKPAPRRSSQEGSSGRA